MTVHSSILSVKNLHTQFSTQHGTVRAVNGISFDLHEGEALGIVGESGSGKSVTALSVMRLVPCPPGQITADSITFEKQNLLTLDKRGMRQIRGGKIAMIFQDPMTSLNPVLKVGWQISESLKLHLGMGRVEARKKTIELLKLVGIPASHERINDYPHQFSGGMRQRVMIAMALACSPRLLIADEPTTALDVTIQAQILDLVKQLRTETGASIIWITHDLGVIAGLCDRILVMYAGCIVESGPVESIYYRPAHGYTMGLLKSIPRLDEEQRIRLSPIEGVPPDLMETTALCPFLPRCSLAQEVCGHEPPPLKTIEANHTAVCWVDLSHLWQK